MLERENTVAVIGGSGRMGKNVTKPLFEEAGYSVILSDIKDPTTVPAREAIRRAGIVFFSVFPIEGIGDVIRSTIDVFDETYRVLDNASLKNLIRQDYEMLDQKQGGVQNDHEMSVIHLNTNPSLGVIDWGGGIAIADQLHFQISANGTLNREPSQVTSDGQIYCYQGQTGPADQPFPGNNQLSSHILFQLIDSNTLKSEYGTGTCSSSFSFSKPVTFMR